MNRKLQLIARTKGLPIGWFVLLVMFSCMVQAQPETPPLPSSTELNEDNPKPHPRRVTRMAQANHQEQLEVIEQFIDMPPAKIASIRRMLEHIEEMSPEQRQAFKAKIQQLRAMPSEKRRKLFKDFRSIPVEQRMVMRRYFQSLPPEERKDARRKFKSMQPEARKQYIATIMEKAGTLSDSELTSRPDEINDIDKEQLTPKPTVDKPNGAAETHREDK